MKTTISDIAKKANVSITAVSFALNNKEGVSKETTEHILKIAQELGYQIPQHNVKKHIIQVVKIITHGKILNKDHATFIAGYLEGLEEGCISYKNRMELCSYNQVHIDSIIEELRENDATGLIIIATELNEKDIAKFSSIKKPLCFIDANYNFLPFSYVDIDNINSVFLLLQYLKSMNHTRIGMITSSYTTPNFKEREEGFKLVLKHLELEYNPQYIMAISPTLEQGYKDLQKIQYMQKLPTAFFCVNDTIAYSALYAIKKQGIHVPDDISIIGFDDLPASKVCEPTLSTIHISQHQIGRRALQLLNQRIQFGIASSPERISICGNLIIRNSVKKLQKTILRSNNE